MMIKMIIEKILKMLFAEPIIPYVELFIIYILIRHFYSKYKEWKEEHT